MAGRLGGVFHRNARRRAASARSASREAMRFVEPAARGRAAQARGVDAHMERVHAR